MRLANTYCVITLCLFLAACNHSKLNQDPIINPEVEHLNKTRLNKANEALETNHDLTATSDNKLATNKAILVDKHTANATLVSSWQIQGAMAAKNKTKGWSATLNWQQKGVNNYQIRLMGPLGSGAMLVTRTGRNVVLKDGNKTFSSTNAEQLLLQKTGIQLPVNNLYYWVRGLPAPGSIQSQQSDGANHLILLKQNGYTINFMQYSTIKGIDLPTVIRLNGNQLMIKVIIKNWSI